MNRIMAKGLTEKQKRFCNEYLKDLNGTQAATRAGYSKKTANEQAARMLAKVSIQEYLQKRMKDRSERTEITQDRVLKEMARIAFFDTRKLFDDEGNLKNITDLDDDTATAIAGLDVVSFYRKGNEKELLREITSKIKVVDKKGALDSIMRHLGMFEKDNVNVTLTFEDWLKKQKKKH